MKKWLWIFLLGVTPILIATPVSQLVDAVEMWWCPECGLAYPASQKTCLNKNCSLFRKKR